MHQIIKNIILLTIILFVACTEEKFEKSKLEIYKSMRYNYEILYPISWIKLENPNKLMLSTSDEISDRAKNFRLESKEKGARIDIFTFKFADTISDIEFKKRIFRLPQLYYSAPIKIYVSGKAEYKYKYNVPLKDGFLDGTLLPIRRNGIAYIIQLETYGDTEAQYSQLFNSVINSLKINNPEK